jgi:hypothetical protein
MAFMGVTVVPGNTKSGKQVLIKPAAQVMYNKCVNGVDPFGSAYLTCSFDQGTAKWYKVILHFITEVDAVLKTR